MISSTFQTDQITLTNSATQMYTLGSTPQPAEDGVVITVPLSRDQIKLNDGLGTSILGTFVNLPANVISDFNNNLFEAITTPLQAQSIILDAFPPSLLFFNIDVDTGSLIQQFSELIALPPISIQSFTLYSDTGLLGPSVSLSTSTISAATNSSLIAIDLSPNDLNYVKFESELAATENNTYITLLADTVQDLAGNTIQVVSLPGVTVSSFNRPHSGGVYIQPEFTTLSNVFQ